ncbi:MAG: peptide chain release factor 1 [bacterium]
MADNISLEELKTRSRELETRLSSDSSLFNDQKELQKVSREYKLIEVKIELLTNIENLSHKIESNTKLLENEKDESMKELLKTETEEFKLQLSIDKQKLEDLNNPNLQKDLLSCIVEIRAGTGGEEAALFASDIFHMYSNYAVKKNWEIAILSQAYAQQGGFKEIIFEVNGEGSYGKLKNESGVHRVQRIPSTEASGRIHTSAVSVVVIPQVEDSEVVVNPQDIKIDVYRASGPGGQGVNTTDSAVRITHLPTGIVVTCQEGRSQLKNKDKAISVLKGKLYELEEEKKLSGTDSIRKSAIKTGDRSDKIKTYNFPQNRMTDHRIKQSWFNLEEIMKGEIDHILTVKIPN